MLLEKSDGEGLAKAGGSNAAEKILNVIDCVFQQESVTFNGIKKQLNIPNATLHRILASLEAQDFMVKDTATDKYSLGIKFIYYGEALKSRWTLTGIAENMVKELAKLTYESVYLSVPYDNYVICLISAQGEASALTSKLTPISHFNCSASGKLFLSEREDEEIKAYFNSGFCARRTVNSICTFGEFKMEQRKIQKEGMAFDNEEYEYGLCCVAAPIFNHKEKIVASIGVSGPLARMRMRDLPAIKTELLEKAGEITEILTKIKYEQEY